MSEKIPLRFWIGRHLNGSGRQCIVDADGGPMEGVKWAWQEYPDRVIQLEAVVQPELVPASLRLLELILGFEKRLGNPTAPKMQTLLRTIALPNYELGIRGERRPESALAAVLASDHAPLLMLVIRFEELFGVRGAPEVCRLVETIAQAAYRAGCAQAALGT